MNFRKFLTSLHGAIIYGPGWRIVNPAKRFSKFAPYSAGSAKAKNKLTFETLDSILKSVSELLDSDVFETKSQPSELKIPNRDLALESTLRGYLNHHGSDKARKHGYERVYANLFSDRRSVERVLEIGLGSASTEFLSNMGRGHVGVGGSLRAWRDFYPNSEIFGADIDRGSLFKEDRISTFWVDQLSRQALESLFGELGDNFDLIIDDGLHNWTANLNTVMSGLRHLKPQGFLVVEDIHPDLKREWGLITRLLSERGLRCAVESFDHALMVIIEKPRG